MIRARVQKWDRLLQGEGGREGGRGGWREGKGGEGRRGEGRVEERGGGRGKGGMYLSLSQAGTGKTRHNKACSGLTASTCCSADLRPAGLLNTGSREVHLSEEEVSFSLCLTPLVKGESRTAHITSAHLFIDQPALSLTQKCEYFCSECQKLVHRLVRLQVTFKKLQTIVPCGGNLCL